MENDRQEESRKTRGQLIAEIENGLNGCSYVILKMILVLIKGRQ